jgi:hypothetical protein
VKVEGLAQQLLHFHMDDALQFLEYMGMDVPDNLCYVIRTQHAALTSIFLHGRLIPGGQALLAAHSALVPFEGPGTFKPLADWLRVAATVKGTTIIKPAQAPTAPLMDSGLQACLLCIVQQDLPGWHMARPKSTWTPAWTDTRSYALKNLMTKFLVRQQPGGSTDVTTNQEKLPSSEVW